MRSLSAGVPGAYGPPAGALKAAAITLALMPQAAAAEVVVAALGDSITAGYGLPPEEGLVPTLEAWLRDRGLDVTVTNAGVSGDTTAGGLARIDWTLTPEVDAIIVALGGNDFLRGVDPAVSRENLDGILDAVDEAGLPALVVGLEVTPNYGPAYKEAFDSMYPELAAEHGALHHPSIFGAIEGDGTDRGAAMAFMQPDGIHPNAEGVERIVEDIGPAVEALIERVPGG